MSQKQNVSKDYKFLVFFFILICFKVFSIEKLTRSHNYERKQKKNYQHRRYNDQNHTITISLTGFRN